MGEQGDPLSNFGGWGVPSPNSDFYTSSILENGGNSLFSGPTEGTFSQNIGNDGFRGGQPMRQSEPKMNTGGRLVERMAARAGFDAPRLNTEGFRPSGGGDSRSTFLTIPPGLSPTTLLESPVFLSNQMAQPSPTTGQFPFAYGGVTTSNFSFAQQDVDKDKENLYGGSNPSSFAFRPVPDSGPSSLLGATNNNFPGFEVSKGISNISSPPDEQEDEVSNQQQPIGDEPLRGAPPEDDGYNWRKYGQKQVKGSDYPRSYFKCTYENCLVKKKVERTQEGDLLEIVYKGSHYHPKPQASRRTGMGMSSDLQIDCVEVTSSASLGAENLQSQTVNIHDLEDVVDGPSAFRNDSNEEDDRVTHVSASEDESESKRRRVENYSAADMSGATRAIREPRVVVQTTSEVDILDDGYRWRKYGQKVVKGNPNPRSYYKCTHAGCSVRKHVERASHDLRSVITTYEGKHNHEVPAARNNSHHNSGSSNNNGQAQSNPALPAQLQRPEQPLLHTAMARFDRPDSAMGSYGRQQMGSSQGFGGFGMGQQVLANLPMAGLGAARNRFPMPAQMPLGQQQNYSNYNEMGFMLPKEEMKMEPFGEAHGNIPNGSAAFQQMMNRMPLGPQI